MTALNVLQTGTAKEMARIAAILEGEFVSPDVLFTTLHRILTRAHIQAALAGRQAVVQGPIQTVLSRILDIFAPLRGGLRNKLASELAYLRDFITEYAAGNLSAAQIAQRLQMYANHTQQTYWGAQTDVQTENGITQERRIVNAGENCGDCLGYQAQGWQPVGTLPEPGEGSVCRANCKCTKEYQ